MLKKFNTLAQWIGLVVITLATAYGSLAFFGHEQVVNAAFGKLETGSAIEAIPAAPADFNYRGTFRDSDGNPIADGEYDITFKIYDSMGAPNALFTQEQNGITVREGNFSTTIGGIPADTFPAGADRYIGVTVEPFAEMVPRERLGSVPYAVLAQNGVPVGGVVDWWRPNDTVPIPDGFVACDGSVVDDPLSPYNGFATPDLRGRMVRGAEMTAAEGTQGGVASPTLNFATILDSHVVGTIPTTAVGDHAHNNGGVTGAITTAAVTGATGTDYRVVTENGSYITDARLWTVAGAASQHGGGGQHAHQLPNTLGAGAHSHNVNFGTLNHSGSVVLDNNPPFHNLLKICRTR
ncbi:MAG: hypothetical protein R3C62_22930 [Chloroflexota bacterium]